MKPDFRKRSAAIQQPTLYNSDGMPHSAAHKTITEWYTSHLIKLIICQRCRQPFLVHADFEGDPPFHGEPPCIGNTMLALDAGDRGGLVEAGEWDAMEAAFLESFWVE